MALARRVWTRVAEKKEDLGAEVRITGASKGDRLRGSGTDRLLHRRDHGYPLYSFHIIFSLRVTHPKLDLPPAPGITFPSPRAALSLSLASSTSSLPAISSSQPFRPYVLLSSTSPWPTFIPISPRQIHISPSRPITTVPLPRTLNLSSHIISLPLPSYTPLAFSLLPIRPRMIPRITSRPQNLILPHTRHSFSNSTTPSNNTSRAKANSHRSNSSSRSNSRSSSSSNNNNNNKTI